MFPVDRHESVAESVNRLTVRGFSSAKNRVAAHWRALAGAVQKGQDMSDNAAAKPHFDELLDVPASNDVFVCTPDDPTAAMALVRQIAASIARRLPSHVDRDELIGLGALGWAEARMRFDPNRGVPFAGFAASRIRGAILDGLRRADSLSRGDRRRARAGEGSAAPRIVSDPAEVAAAVDRSTDELDTSDHLAREQMRDELRAAVVRLSERERHVLTRHFFDEIPMRAIGEELGVTESRISQIISAALVRLRSALGVVELKPRKRTRAGTPTVAAPAVAAPHARLRIAEAA